jgi:hypothetical protein
MVHDLVCQLQIHKPSIVFLIETRQSEQRVKNLRFRLGMQHCLHAKGQGNGGGIALYWVDGIDIDLLSFSRRYFDVHIQEREIRVATVALTRPQHNSTGAASACARKGWSQWKGSHDCFEIRAQHVARL